MIRGTLTATVGTIVSQKIKCEDGPVGYIEAVVDPSGRNISLSGASINGRVVSVELIGEASSITGTASVFVQDDLGSSFFSATVAAATKRGKDTTDDALHWIDGPATLVCILAVADSGKRARLRFNIESNPSWP